MHFFLGGGAQGPDSTCVTEEKTLINAFQIRDIGWKFKVFISIYLMFENSEHSKKFFNL